MEQAALRSHLQETTESTKAAAHPSLLIVDDYSAVRAVFQRRFENRYVVHGAADGAEALAILRREPGVGVVVTDVSMPVMSGLELIRMARPEFPDIGFIVVSGQFETDDVIQVLRGGARNFLRKPYSGEEIEHAVATELERFRAIQQSRDRREGASGLENFIVGLDGVSLRFPTDLSRVNTFAFRLSGMLRSMYPWPEEGRLDVALGLIEMLTNAMEHGNLGITGEEKLALKQQGESIYAAELARRAAMEPLRSRNVLVHLRLDSDQATYRIEDEGKGFDTASLPDPSDPARLFEPSGRGILLARAFMDEIHYSPKGNVVTLVKRRGIQRTP